MGEAWMGLWIAFFIGIFILCVVIYDYRDRKKRNQEIKVWKYIPAVVIALILMFPAGSGIVVMGPRFIQRMLAN